MAITVSNSSALLKTLYQDRDPAWTALQRSKFLAEVKKDTEYGGDDNATVNVTISGPAGVSSTFSTARSNVSATVERKFALGSKKLYAITQIDAEAVFRSQTKKQALVKLLDHNTKHLVEKFNRALSGIVWSIGGGALTKLTAGGATLTNAYFTCDPITDAGRFEVGDKVVFSSDDGTGSSPAGLRDSGATLTVTAVDLSTGVVTFGAALNTISGLANTDYCLREGDYTYAFSGIRGWIPTTAPTSGDSFKGVDRSVNVTRLAGMRYAVGGLKLDSIRQGMALASQLGAAPDRLYCNPFDFAEIESELSSKSYIDLPNANPKLGHRGLSYESPAGTLIIVSEPYVPRGYGYALNMSTWRLRTAGDCPRYITTLESGRERILHMLEASDAFELRIGAYGELECQNPGQNLVITW